jgi:hypothetical protein
MKSKRNPKMALCVQEPRLTTKSPGRGPDVPGHPVPRGARGTEYAPRNPMHDREPLEQEAGRSDPIRQQHKLKGVR